MLYHDSLSDISVMADSDESNEEDEEVLRALAASMESMKKSSAMSGKDKDTDSADNGQETGLPRRPTYPPLPEEPKGDRNLLCRVGVRLPDGRRVQRNFLRTDPIQVNIVLFYSCRIFIAADFDLFCTLSPSGYLICFCFGLRKIAFKNDCYGYQHIFE